MASSIPKKSTDLSDTFQQDSRNRQRSYFSSLANPSPSPAEKVTDSDNMLTEILLHLPASALVKLKSVSRRWNFFISSLQFSLLHTSLHPPRTISPSGIFLRRIFSHSSSYQFLSLSSSPSLSAPFSLPIPSPNCNGIKILQSCNGLFLCCTIPQSMAPRDYFIYNPTTSRFKKLPCPLSSEFSSILGVCLAFHPIKLPHYILVCVGTTASSAYSYRIDVFFSDAGRWKEWGGNDFHAPYDIGFSNGVFWNGSVHWVSLREDSLYFDIVHERLVKMPSPPVSRKWAGGNFCEGDGGLFYVAKEQELRGYYKVNMMESYDVGWFLKYNVDVDGVVAICPEMIGRRDECLVLCIVRLGEKERLVMVVHVPGKILAHDLEDGSFEKLCDVVLQKGDARAKLQFGWFDAFPCAESLISV
ncbi:hypothetical protein Ancab_002610 [Ancistrocladus abbreviatus]